MIEEDALLFFWWQPQSRAYKKPCAQCLERRPDKEPWRGSSSLKRSRELDTLAREQADAMAKDKKLAYRDAGKLCSKLEHQPKCQLGTNIATGNCAREMHAAMMEHGSSYPEI
jgi:hypothetical protein